MKASTIRRALYKVLRKTGVPREKINENSNLKHEVLFDELDFTCFMFLLETIFHVEADRVGISEDTSLGNTIELLEMHCA